MDLLYDNLDNLKRCLVEAREIVNYVDFVRAESILSSRDEWSVV
jgi:hypothetical protein